ncbi:MAG: LysR family transcriptional regulator [Planctomycetales bacterium]|nr:LysR family transcriptional regulator [Planctomycetales bacterium]
MQIKLLKVFCDIVAQRSFSRGAKENAVSQSAASQMIHHLEERLGVVLMDRSRRPFVLTPEGELFYRESRKLVERYYALETEVRTLHEEVAGRVRVASIYSVGLSHMNQCVRRFLGEYPKANVRIEYQHPDRVYSLVEQDEADVGLVSYPKNSRSIKAIMWRTEPMVLVCSPEHELAKLDRASIKHLHGQPTVAFQNDLRIRSEIDKILSRYGVEVNVVMEFDNTETIKRALEINAGVALLPKPTVEKEILAGSLVALPLEDDAIVRPLGIIQRRGKMQARATRQFIDFLLKHADVHSMTEDGVAICDDPAPKEAATTS